MDAETRQLWNTYALPDDRRSWAEVPEQWAAYARSQADAFPYLQQTVVELHQAGVPLLVGTDLGNPGVLAGFAVHQEMRLWQQAGLSAAETLRAATLTPARLLGVDDRLGTVAVGKTASLILTRKNPLVDIKNAREIVAVVARGHYYNRAALDQLLQNAHLDVLAHSPVPRPNVALSLPGEIVAQGRYQLRYQEYPDGVEEFRITKDAMGYQFEGFRRQTGFGRYTIVFTARYDLDFSLREVRLTPQVLLPTVEQYEVHQGFLEGSALRNRRPLRTTRLQAGRSPTLRSPLLATDFFLFQKLQNTLAVGEQQRMETLYADGSSGSPMRRIVNITRRDDETIRLAPDQEPRVCRHYEIVPEGNDSSTPATEIWTNERGLPVRQVITEGKLQRSAVWENLL